MLSYLTTGVGGLARSGVCRPIKSGGIPLRLVIVDVVLLRPPLGSPVGLSLYACKGERYVSLGDDSIVSDGDMVPLLSISSPIDVPGFCISNVVLS